jgi:N-acylneuraminate cytidylyltransferase
LSATSPSTLAVVPARGGSRGIPGKNIRPLGGRPLLAWTVDAARAASGIDRLVVSTDDPEIRGVAVEFGVEVVDRPAELAADASPTEDALIHALDACPTPAGDDYDVVLTLEPTSPFRTAGTIERCLEIFATTDADSVIAVVETRSNYGRIVDGRFEFLFPDQPRRRQDRPPLFKESSTLYATRSDVLRRKRSVLGDRLHALRVGEDEATDINEPRDLAWAEAWLRARGTTE